MDKKNIIIGVVVAVVVLAGGFFGGIKYGQSAGALQKLSQTQRQALFASTRGNGTGGGGGFGGRNGGGGQGGFTVGDIISKDDKSITVKTPNGSTKLILLAASSQVSKSAAGTLTDLTAGETVMVTGQPNSDGSITAQNIQVRPSMPVAK